ncbi:hypothetical protein BXU09_19485 [Deinococcus sp. LM3]|nr:hypothetical protein BXU09_19485 [Deinococcus sp. LM3]
MDPLPESASAIRHALEQKKLDLLWIRFPHQVADPMPFDLQLLPPVVQTHGARQRPGGAQMLQS